MKSKKVIICILALTTFISTTAFAREIKGRVVDAKTGEAIPYASVSIHSLLDSAVVDYAITTDEGVFVSNKVGEGDTFFIRVSSIGYLTEQRLFSELTSLSDISIALQPDCMLLDEVVVAGRKKTCFIDTARRVLCHG